MIFASYISYKVDMLRVGFHTLGCKVNQYETEAMKENFRKEGFEIAEEGEIADIYIINTCTVTSLADRKSRQYIRRVKRLSPDSLIAVTGCYSQVKPQELEEMEEVDLITGNGEKGKMVDFIRAALEIKGMREMPLSHLVDYRELTEYADMGIITSMESRTRAYIKIQEGCDRFCAYCMIPFARGPIRSRDPEKIVLEAKTLIDQGFKEIVLTGINTALYGNEKDFPYPLLEDEAGMKGIEIIIKRINAIEGGFRIRLSSLEPTVVNAEYVKRLLAYEKLCPHIHLSLQSGSNKILKTMRRRYSREEYLEIVKVLREHDKGYGITTDIIVGFPGEEEVDFQDSLDMIQRVNFAKVHAFKYSKREGTSAAKMKNQVPGIVKNERSDRLMICGEKGMNTFFKSLIGQEREVLFENVEGDILSGYSDNYIKIYCLGSEKDLNKIKKVKLTEVYLDGMKGEIM